jgi:uncharacterized membrane protein YtjA (UPF0391 family)
MISRFGTVCAALVSSERKPIMLTWALIFFIIAIIAAVLGFSGLAAGAAGVAKILFWAFLAIALVIGITHLIRGGVAT